MNLPTTACGAFLAFAMLSASACTTPSADNPEVRLYADNPRRAMAAYERRSGEAPDEVMSAETPFSGTVSSSELYNYALEHHPKIQAAHIEWGAALRRIDASRRQPDAMLSWSESLYPIETRLGPIDRRFMLEQRFFNPWKLDAREGQATVMAGRKRIAFYEVSAQVRRDIDLAYIELQARDGRVAVLRELAAALKGIEEIIEANIATNQATQAQLLRAQVEREELESQIEREGLRRRALLAQLAEACGFEGILEIETNGLDQALPNAEELRSELYAGVLSHPLIAMQNSLALLEDEKLKEAEAERLPDYSLALEYSIVGGRGGVVEDEGLDALAIRVGITIPWHFGVYDAKEDAIAIQRRAEVRKADAITLTLIRRVEDQIFILNDAQRESKLYLESVLPKSKQALELAMTDFAVGRATLIDVLDAERAVLASKLALVRVHQMASKATSELAYLSGHELNNPNTND